MIEKKIQKLIIIKMKYSIKNSFTLNRKNLIYQSNLEILK